MELFDEEMEEKIKPISDWLVTLLNCCLTIFLIMTFLTISSAIYFVVIKLMFDQPWNWQFILVPFAIEGAATILLTATCMIAGIIDKLKSEKKSNKRIEGEKE